MSASSDTNRLSPIVPDHQLGDLSDGDDGLNTWDSEHRLPSEPCKQDQWMSRRRVIVIVAFGLVCLALCILGAFTVAGETQSDLDSDASASEVVGSTQLEVVPAVRKLETGTVPSSNGSTEISHGDSLASMWPGSATISSLSCRAPKNGDDCHTAVVWSMMDGIWSNPEWYTGLSLNSSFADFQDFMHKGGRAGCAPACHMQKATAESVSSTPNIRRRRRDASTGSLAYCRRRDGSAIEYSPGWECSGDNVVPHHGPVGPTGPYINHYDGNNPLNIKARSTRSDNFFIILGDWGKAYGIGECQQAVANKMKQYVDRQKAAGKSLLTIASVGDNFYWTGAQPQKWDTQWEKAYGSGKDTTSPLYQVPWIVTLGNHDYGDDDPYALCPHVQPTAHVEGQAYASQQFNKDRNPTRPDWTDMYWLPDYNFHYAVPEADLEFISFDTSSWYVGEHRGGEAEGFRGARDKCGGWHVCKHFLHRIQEAGKELLRNRARENTASTVVILQHYPGSCHRHEFMNHLPSHRQGKVKVICAWGHDHEQKCFEKNADGQCHEILTGGGGGCCGSWGSRGFTAVHLTDDGGFTVDMESDDVKLPLGSCRS